VHGPSDEGAYLAIIKQIMIMDIGWKDYFVHMDYRMKQVAILG
jgi:hypothetical protein